MKLIASLLFLIALAIPARATNLDLQIVRPITLAQLPPDTSVSADTSTQLSAPVAPPSAGAPATPSQLMQQVDKAAGYIPTGWDLKIGSDFSIGISTDVGDFYVVGARDYNNGQWLSGWGKELLPMKWKGREVAYIAAQNVYNADEGGRGAIGGAIGIRPVNLLNAVGEVSGVAGNLLNLPPFAKQLNNFVSIEAGYDYRLQNVPGVSRHVATIGGQVRVPFDLIKGL